MPELRFTHTDDLEWQEVRALEDQNGNCVSAREKFLEFTENRLSQYAEWDPGMVVHRHGHNSEQIVFVIAGEITIDGRLCTPGTFMVLEQGASMGPMIAGPNGVTLFESLALARPFDAPTREALYASILRDEAPDLRRAAAGVSRDVAAVCATAMAKEPDARYQTALDFAEDLRRARQGGPIQAREADARAVRAAGQFCARAAANASSAPVEKLL